MSSKLNVRVKVGQRLQPDSWEGSGSDLQKSSWDKADFFLPSAQFVGAGRHVNVTVTGKTAQWKHGMRRVRVRVDWLEDKGDKAEVEHSSGGWLFPDWEDWSFDDSDGRLMGFLV